ncbi:hypothetical protein HHUSO_G33689, partial [Huso huso]
LIILGAAGKNPFSRPLSYSAFIPWIGAASRIGQTLPKTEALKGMPSRKKLRSAKLKSQPECKNEYDLIFPQASRCQLAATCQEMGVSGVGSRTDLINRLQELLLYKDIYPKMFVKLQKTGGGVLHTGCMHSVVYYHSPLWWQESAQDHSDALLSFKHPPNMYISDIAGRVARHTNNRTEQKCFQPRDGRLCAATEENIQNAQEKTLKIDLPWLAALKFKGLSVQTEHAAADRYTQVHPFTGTKERYSLYDRLRKKKFKTRPEGLRSMTFSH